MRFLLPSLALCALAAEEPTQPAVDPRVAQRAAALLAEMDNEVQALPPLPAELATTMRKYETQLLEAERWLEVPDLAQAGVGFLAALDLREQLSKAAAQPEAPAALAQRLQALEPRQLLLARKLLALEPPQPLEPAAQPVPSLPAQPAQDTPAETPSREALPQRPAL